MKRPVHPTCRLLAVALAILAFALPARADEPKKTEPDKPVQLTAQQDHKRMMELLGIKELRRGAERQPEGRRTPPTTTSPRPTRTRTCPTRSSCKDGKKVTTAEQWWKKRRPEIVEDFDREVYGRVPKDTPKVKWEVTATDKQTVGDVPVVTKRLVGHVDNSAYPPITVDIQLTLTTPGEGDRAGAGHHGVRVRRFGGQGAGRPAGRRQGRADLAAAGARRRAGATRSSSRTASRPTTARGLTHGHHRPVQQGPAAQAGRLGRAAGLGVGRQPGARLLRDRQGRGRQAGRHRGAVAVRQGGDRDAWPTTSGSPSGSSARPARAGRSCTAATSASWSRTWPAPASTTGWPATTSSTPAR